MDRYSEWEVELGLIIGVADPKELPTAQISDPKESPARQVLDLSHLASMRASNRSCATSVDEAVARVCALGARAQLAKFVPTVSCQFTLTIGTCFVWSGRESALWARKIGADALQWVFGQHGLKGCTT